MAIYFVSFFKSDHIAGGIKTMYRNVELLNEIGHKSAIWQPDGRASWFDSTAPVIRDCTLTPHDALVFPELFVGSIRDLVTKKLPCQKILFSQNQHYSFNDLIPAQSYQELGFTKFIVPASSTQQFFKRVFGLNSHIIPPYIDPKNFYPEKKLMQIAYSERKMAGIPKLIREILHHKYPALRQIPWINLLNTSETCVASALRKSTVLLSLGQLESLGLVPLEAMSAGTAVVGYHGYGGLEYATPENGHWFGADYTEEVADALATVIGWIANDDKKYHAMLAAGQATAKHYSRDATITALKQAFDL